MIVFFGAIEHRLNCENLQSIVSKPKDGVESVRSNGSRRQDNTTVISKSYNVCELDFSNSNNAQIKVRSRFFFRIIVAYIISHFKVNGMGSMVILSSPWSNYIS